MVTQSNPYRSVCGIGNKNRRRSMEKNNVSTTALTTPATTPSEEEICGSAKILDTLQSFTGRPFARRLPETKKSKRKSVLFKRSAPIWTATKVKKATEKSPTEAVPIGVFYDELIRPRKLLRGQKFFRTEHTRESTSDPFAYSYPFRLAPKRRRGGFHPTFTYFSRARAFGQKTK